MLRQRATATIIVTPLVLFLIYLGGYFYWGLILLVLVGGAWEYNKLLNKVDLHPARIPVITGVVLLTLSRGFFQFSYSSAILVILHFMWLSKDPREPRRYGIILALLLVTRIPFVKNALLNLRRRYKIRRQASPINTPIQSH